MIVANYLLEIELLDCHTKVIREFVVPADIFLSNLHEIIQIVMGWTNSHMHQFNTVEGCYGQIMYGDDDREKPQDELTTQLKNIVSKENPVFEYIYDMGDDWIHKITVKSFDYTDKLPQMPYCISAVGACPPEDVGGPDGYENFCLAINERKNPEYKEICEWVYDLCGYRKSQKWPDGVSVPKINKTLKPIDLSPAASNAVSADEQSSHFVETVYSWGLHFLEEWKVPPERQKELWRMIAIFPW